jgi:hypothetical protein
LKLAEMSESIESRQIAPFHQVIGRREASAVRS